MKLPAYIIALLITGIIWSILFLKYKDHRKEQLVISFLIMPFVFIDYFASPLYWTPETFLNIPIGIEGFIFTFFIAGIAAVIYEDIFHKNFKWKKETIKLIKLLYFIPLLTLAITIWYLFKTEFIYTVILFMLAISLTISFVRKDLVKDIVVSSISFTTIYFAAFTIWILLAPEALDWWQSKLHIGLVPLEEILFALAFGAFVGPIYEYMTEGRIAKSRK